MVISTPLHELLISLDVPREGAARAMQALVVRIARAWRQGPSGHIEVGPRGMRRRATGGVLLTPDLPPEAYDRLVRLATGTLDAERLFLWNTESARLEHVRRRRARGRHLRPAALARMSPANASSAASAAAAEPADSMSRISWLAMITPSAERTDRRRMLRRPHAEAHRERRRDLPPSTPEEVGERRVDGDLAARHAGDRDAVDEALGPPADRREPVVARRRRGERHQRHPGPLGLRTNLVALVDRQVRE